MGTTSRADQVFPYGHGIGKGELEFFAFRNPDRNGNYIRISRGFL